MPEFAHHPFGLDGFDSGRHQVLHLIGETLFGITVCEESLVILILAFNTGDIVQTFATAVLATWTTVSVLGIAEHNHTLEEEFSKDLVKHNLRGTY